MSHEEGNKLQELNIPSGAMESPGSQEILRAWVTVNGLEVALSKPWEEPDNWGIFLVDLARHAARIYEMEHYCSFDDAMDRIKTMFEAEWQQPTDIGATSPQETQH